MELQEVRKHFTVNSSSWIIEALKILITMLNFAEPPMFGNLEDNNYFEIIEGFELKQKSRPTKTNFYFHTLF